MGAWGEGILDNDEDYDVDAMIESAWQTHTPKETKLVWQGWVLQIVQSNGHPYYHDGDYLWWERNPDTTDSFGSGPFPGWRRTSRPDHAARFTMLSEAHAAASEFTTMRLQLVKLSISIEVSKG